MATVTIGWFPRERFAVSAESLRSLIENSPPCRLIIVDPATPERYMREIREVLGARRAEIVSTGRPVLPSAAKNLILERVDTDYVALVENDVLFPPNWLETLIAACEEVPADVAAPLLYEGRGSSEHFDRGLGRIRESRIHPGRFEVVPLAAPRNAAREREKVDFVEQHCLVFRARTFDRIGPFRELYTRDDVDVGFSLWKAGCTAVLEPAVGVHFIGPTSRPEDDELPFYRHRWDLAGAMASREEIRERWDLVETPGDLAFVQYRNRMLRLPEVRRDLEKIVALPGATVLVENRDWLGTEVTSGLAMRPFPEVDGRYGGFPASSVDAIAALDRAIERGAAHIVVGYPAFWWFDYLPGLSQHLASTCRLVRDDELLRVFEVRETLTT